MEGHGGRHTTTRPAAGRTSRLLRKQIQMGYWPGFIVGMYPSQFAYEPVQPAFDTLWRGIGDVNVYVHVPFCQWSCRFCTFFKVVQAPGADYDAYIDRLCEQIRYYSAAFDEPPVIKSLCFGGGTPNVLTPEQLGRVIATFRSEGWSAHPDLQPSVEVSPEILTEDAVAGLASIGVRRLSLGVQSLRDDVRRSARRVRPMRLPDVVAAIRGHKLAMNIDVINGLHGQTPEVFMETLEGVVALGPETISVYLMSGSNSSLFAAEPHGTSPREKYALFDEYFRYLPAHGYDCESHVKWIRHDTTITHQQKIYEYEGTATLGIGCGARSYNPVMHYGTPWYRSTAQSSQLLGQFLTRPWEELPWRGYLMTKDDARRRHIIYSFFLGALDPQTYARAFGSDPLADFPDEFAALVANGLVTTDQAGMLRSTDKGRKYTDLMGTLFWSDAVRRRFDPACPTGRLEAAGVAAEG